MKAQRCPVCFGEGRISNNEFGIYEREKKTKICHGCGGKGWVIVPEDRPYWEPTKPLKDKSSGQ